MPQAWSAALLGHPIGADGIAYHARHDDTELCYALFDRSANAIEEIDRGVDLDQDWGGLPGTTVSGSPRSLWIPRVVNYFVDTVWKRNVICATANSTIILKCRLAKKGHFKNLSTTEKFGCGHGLEPAELVG